MIGSTDVPPFPGCQCLRWDRVAKLDFVFGSKDTATQQNTAVANGTGHSALGRRCGAYWVACAAYWLACAADEIYADRSSILGSIGVIMASFGAHEFIAKHGIERRVYTSGESKSQLDPFKPEDPKDVERIKAVGSEIHEAFIEHVKAARRDKLADDPSLFTGEFWVGQKAVDLGLADGIGHLVPFMKEKFGKDVKFAVLGPKKSLFKRFGAQIAEDAIASVEDRAAWARFGL